MHLVYNHVHFLCYPQGLVKAPQTFSLYSILHVILNSVAN